MKTVHADIRVGDHVRHPDSRGEAIVTGFNLNQWAEVRWLQGNSCIKPEDLVLVERPLFLTSAEVECLEVFADGSVEMLGDHSRSVMAKMMLDIAKRAKG